MIGEPVINRNGNVCSFRYKRKLDPDYIIVTVFSKDEGISTVASVNREGRDYVKSLIHKDQLRMYPTDIVGVVNEIFL